MRNSQHQKNYTGEINYFGIENLYLELKTDSVNKTDAFELDFPLLKYCTFEGEHENQQPFFVNYFY